MKKKKLFIRKAIASVLVSIMVLAQGMTVLAEDVPGAVDGGAPAVEVITEDTVDTEITSGDITETEENDPEEVSEETGDNAIDDASGEETADEEASEQEEESELPSEEESISEGEDASEIENASEVVSETEDEETSEVDGELPEDSEEEGDLIVFEGEISEMFPGLSASYELSVEELEEKEEVAEYSYNWEDLSDENAYVKDQLVFLADTREEAQAYADAYNARLERFEYGVAVIRLNADPSFAHATVLDAMRAAADINSQLPAVWPNYYCYLLEEGDAEEELENTAELMADPYLTPSNTSYQWYHSIVNSTVAYEQGYTGKGVTVAVLDAGARTDHQDLKGIKSMTVTSKLGTSPSGNHGANVAGIIGAKADNGYGGRGIAPDATLLTLKVLTEEEGGSDADIMTAINMLISENGANKADIINLSLGGQGYNGSYNTVIKNAYKSGVAVFCAAGNGYSEGVNYPAGYDKAYAVAAVDYNLNKTTFSNYGSKVKYSAPGYEMYSCSNESTSKYCVMSGTSQATPVISGCAAVLLGSGKVTGTGSKRVDNLIKLMDKGAVKVKGNGLGKGYVDLAKALGLSTKLTAPAKPEFVTSNAKPFETSTASIQLKCDKGCTIYYSTDGKAVTYKNGVLSDNAKTYSSSITISGAATVTINAIAVKSSNQMASANVSKKYTLKPKVSSINVVSKSDTPNLYPGKKMTMVANLNPEYAAVKKVKWSISPVDKNVTISSSGVVSASSKATPGSKYTVSATATDGSGCIGTKAITVSSAPAVTVKTITAKNTKICVAGAGSSKTVNVSSILTGFLITKSDKSTSAKTTDLLWYTDKNSIVSVSTAGVITYSNKYGTAKVYGVATDGSGKKITATITVVNPGISITGPTSVIAGKSITLKAVIPAQGSSGKINWEVSPAKEGVTVSGGKVTVKSTVASGSCTIKATTTDGTNQSASIAISITKDGSYISAIKITDSDKQDVKTVDLFRVSNTGNALIKKNVTVACTKSDKTTSTLWTVTSSNPGIVTAVKSGNSIVLTATGKATGTATITVAASDGGNKKATFKVNVKNPATKLLISRSGGRAECVAKGTSLQLNAYLESDYGKLDASAKKLEWTSSNPDVLKVDKSSGKVTGKATTFTKVTITARTTDGSGLTASIELYSCDKAKDIYCMSSLGIRIDPNWYYLKVSGTAKKGGFLVGMTSANKGKCCPYFTCKTSSKDLVAECEWNESYKTYIVTMTAKKKGEYKLTLSCNDGSSAKVTYVVRVE